MIELFLCLAIYYGRAYSDLYDTRRRKKDAIVFGMIEHDQWNGNGYALNLKESLALSSVCKPFRITYRIMYYVGG